ncbi:type I restriction endonuclease subunit R [Methanobrevibacter sp. AbM4]|uniref:type I restriction endonuclease subunit R n=1 Tax=Methanobrevibacter sp. AbM4 TaxID=224719 RepID=UPI000334871A|nr:type I restriction endonuclease [Methanobrevibacter sp. AbM4]AGN16000.1 type I restriction-modification system R subunit HsdR1 [Methanobrevibacter sp. AbM4]
MNADISEKSFQKDIINYLTSTGYIKRVTKDYHTYTCLDIELVLNFIKTTQKKAWDKFYRIHKDKSDLKFIESLVNYIQKKGTIHVLRNGFKDISQFKLFYPMPNSNLNPELEENYKKNIFSIIDELQYEDRNNGNRLDLVIFINGIPVSTIELKNTFSQGVENAIKQYKEDRDPNESIFKRCLVHFAMSDEKIYMTTKLQGAKTKFLPFNKGINNPDVEGNYKTSYLYTEILQPNQLSRLINNFIFNEDGNIIFPRFHQLDCVNLLLKKPEPGYNYLIQHSAGSGKTKTIAWLAHGLLNKFDFNNNRVYDMVIVVSDRKVIDGQLQKQIKSIEKKRGIVDKIDKNSKQLAEAIKSGSNIVVTTLHKFSYILDEIKDVENRKYAVIIDEAHSSQTGSYARNLRKGLSNKEVDEFALDEAEDDIDEMIITELERARDTSNISFFAFTATPKSKTLEMFGYKNELGEYRPHHLYTMKQAIEEGFILDVLKNYLTYNTYFKLVKTVEDDPDFNEEKTKKVLRKFVEEHPHTIKTKSEIILDHFMNSTYYKIKGQARAMIVTSSRKEAVLYKLEIDRQIKNRKLPIKTLAAFTGSIEHDTVEYTENNINDIGNTSIEKAFKKDPYRILIVANKFQTGFDEPLLHTMYVDKMLNGVAAVQTLSRVNRIYPNKTDTLILDFVNDTDTIKKAFEPYYGETYLKEATNYHKLYELMDNIYEFDLFYEEDVNTFVKKYKSNTNQQVLHVLINKTVDNFKKLNEEEKVNFKKTVKRYQSIYSFLSQLLPFSDLEMEKLYIYNKFLTKKLPTVNKPLPYIVLEDVDMDSYKIDTDSEIKSISLGDSESGLSSISPNGSKYRPEEFNKLSQIIETLNETFKTDFTENDKVFLNTVKENMLQNEDLTNKVLHNSKENVEAVFDNYFDDEINSLINSNLDLFNKINGNERIRNELKSILLDEVYKQNRISNNIIN